MPIPSIGFNVISGAAWSGRLLAEALRIRFRKFTCEDRKKGGKVNNSADVLWSMRYDIQNNILVTLSYSLLLNNF